MTAETVQQVWTVSLIVYAVVVIVVAVLLTLILRTVTRIHAGASAIWDVGQRVANNTIQIPLLNQTNHLVAEILASAGRVADGAGAIRRHAEGCPGCPSCVLGGRR
jgi:uncharacterized membrane protein YagU involved in acid resistance